MSVSTEKRKFQEFIAQYKYDERVLNDEKYYSDEEPDNSETQNADMNIYCKEAN
jgi:hypothetical protein